MIITFTSAGSDEYMNMKKPSKRPTGNPITNPINSNMKYRYFMFFSFVIRISKILRIKIRNIHSFLFDIKKERKENKIGKRKVGLG